MRALAALGVVIGGAVAAFAVYTFGWHNDDGSARASRDDVVRHAYTLKQGDVAHVPAADVLRRRARGRLPDHE